MSTRLYSLPLLMMLAAAVRLALRTVGV